MSKLSALAITPWESTELNPLIPSPAAVIAVLIIGSLVFVALVAAGVFLGIRMASSRRATETSRQES
jgi:hypothetical protein